MVVGVQSLVQKKQHQRKSLKSPVAAHVAVHAAQDRVAIIITIIAAVHVAIAVIAVIAVSAVIVALAVAIAATARGLKEPSRLSWSKGRFINTRTFLRLISTCSLLTMDWV